MCILCVCAQECVSVSTCAHCVCMCVCARMQECVSVGTCASHAFYLFFFPFLFFYLFCSVLVSLLFACLFSKERKKEWSSKGGEVGRIWGGKTDRNVLYKNLFQSKRERSSSNLPTGGIFSTEGSL